VDYDVIGKELSYSEKWLLLSATHQPFIVTDARLELRFEQWEGSEYIRGWMGVPMVVHDKLIGFINLDSRKPNAFTEKDAIAAQTFANSAAVAIENARLFEAERQSREKADALREATAALTTSIELEAIYATILDSLTKLVPFDSASIEILDQGNLEVVAGRGLKNNIICIGEQYPYDDTKWGEMETLRQPMLIANVQNDDRFIKFEGTEYIRGWMGVPMFAQDKLVGLLNLDSSTENFFTADHAALAQTFGNQAAIAIENARLFEAEQKRRREAEVLRQASAALTSSLELEEVLDTLLNQIAILIPYNSAAVFMREKEHYKVVAGKGFKHLEKVIGQSFPLDDKLSSIVRETRQAIISHDIQKDPRFQNWGDSEGIHGWMCFPLIVRDQVIGHLTIDSYQVGAYTESDAELALAFANQAATALENARLFEAEQRRHRESETLRQAALAITTSLELEKVLETILIVMKQVVPYDSASVLLLDGDDKLYLTAAQGFPNNEEILNLQLPADDRLFMQVKNSEKPVILKNAQQDERFQKWANTNYVCGWMGVPLILRNEVIGYITLDSRQEGIYDETLAALAQAFANQAASAIQNARQFQVEQRHFREAETLRQTAEAITSTLDIQQVLTSILDNLNRVVPFDSAGVFLIENDKVRLTEVKGMPDREDALDKLFPASNALLQEIWHTRLPLILKDAQNDSRYEGWVGNQVRGWMGVPLIARGVIIGYITIDSQRVGAYNEHDANLVMTFAHQAAAAIENARLYERGEQQIRQFTVLRDIDSAISSSFDLRVTLNLLIGYAVRELNADAVAILLYNSDLKSLSLYASTGFTSKHNIPSSHIRIGEGLAGRVVLQRKLVHIADLSTATDFSLDTYCIDENFKSYFGVPLIGKGQIKGVLEVYTREESYPDPDWLNFLNTLAGQAAIAIDNVQLFKNLQRSNQELILAYDTTLAGWGRALELRDKETQGHTDRVVELTIELARRMGIDGEELTHIMRGTLLHDIGKMGIPDQILHKPGPLTEEEWVIMRQHPQYAFNLMNPIPYLRPALAIPYSHHERWDGSGYPRGLKGEDIPLAARIFAVVDIWDALLYERVYRDAWPEEKVIEYIKNTAGIELDPKIVEKFLELIDEERTRNQAE
jgi:GAF domain-containing protein